MTCEGIFLNKLRQRGFRLTPQREMVLSVMHQVEGFATADEIYDRVHFLSSSVDISTIYRTLDLLQDFKMVSSVEAGSGQRVYTLLGTRGPHIHLVCSVCGKVLGADLDLARPLVASLRENYGFEADLNHLSIPGRCQDCQSSLQSL
jgi:Fur family ferric uptake transcriptional regulator